MVKLIEFGQRIKRGSLGAAFDSGGGIKVIEWGSGGVELDTGVFAGKKAGVPCGLRDGLAFGAGAHDDEGGEVIGDVSKAIGDPGSHAGAARDRGAGIHEGVGRVMIDLIGLQGSDDTDVVGDLLEIGQKVGNHLAGLAALFETDVSAEALEGSVLKEREFNPLGEFLGDGFAIEFAELRFVIEGLELGRASCHVEIDDAFGLGCMVGNSAETILGEEIGKRRAKERRGGSGKEVATWKGC